MNDVDMIFSTSSSAAIDQLPVDVVGQLLLLLEDADIQRIRLVCKAWLVAVDHQLRVLHPLYLPKSCSVVFSSCEALHAGIARCGGQQSSTAHADPLRAGEFSWAAPTRHFNSLCSSMQHVAELDLSGQQLPGNCITLLSQHTTRLKSLTLDASRLPASEMCRIAAFAALAQDHGVEAVGLSHLSLAGVHLVPAPSSGSPAGNKQSGQDGQHTASPSAQAAGTSTAGSSSRFHASVEEILSAIAANALTHLDLSRTVKCAELLSVTGRPQALHAPLALPVLGRCSQLGRLQRSLVSLKLIGNTFNADDWHNFCNKLTLLTELHMSWDTQTDDLSLNATAFQEISRLQRLQSLRVLFRDGGLVHEPYSLTPLAQTLTAVHLSGTASLSLVLSLTECSNVRQLTLQNISSVAGTPESVVQVLCSMPLLQELQLVQIESPVLERVGMCHFGDYVLSQLDCCCPHLTKLVMPDAELNGTGIRLAATTPVLPSVASTVLDAPSSSAAAAAATAAAAVGGSTARPDAEVPSSEGLPGSGALRRLRHLELNATNLMSSALPHLSCLVNLHSLTLWHLKPSQFTHACRFDCFRFVSALTRLTSLNIPRAKYTSWNPDAAGAAPALGAAALGGGGGVPNHPIVDELDDMLDIDLLQPFQEFMGSESLDGSEAGEDSDSEEEWEDASDGEGDLPEAAPPAEQQQEQQQHVEPVLAAAGAAAGGQQGVPGVGAPAQQQQQEQEQEPQPVGMEVDVVEQQQQQDEPANAVAGPAVLGVPGAAAVGAGLVGPAAAPPVPNAQMLQQLLQQGGPGLNNILAQLQAGVGGGGGVGGPMPLAAMLQQGLAAGQAQQGQAVLQQMQQMAQVVANAQGVVGGQLADGQNLNGQFVQLAPAVPPAQLAQAMQGVQQAAAQVRAHRTMEPHLHFLARLQNLECLNLGCLNTKGACLMHLNSVTRLQTLVLSGRITLSDASIDLLSNLRLPSIKHLSITECRFDTDGTGASPLKGAASISLNSGDSGGSSSGGAGAGAAQESAWTYPMDRFVCSVLCGAFPNCQDVKLGSCDKLSIAGLAVLLQQMPRLQRLWLVGCFLQQHGPLDLKPRFGLTPQTSRPLNFKSRRAGWAGPALECTGEQPRGKQQGGESIPGTDLKAVQHAGHHNHNAYPSRSWTSSAGQQQQQQHHMGGQGVASGCVLPGPPDEYITLGVPFRSEVSAAELAWVVEQGVLVRPEMYASHATATAAAGASTQPEAAAAARGVPEGAVVLPCVAVSGLKYVSITDTGGVNYRFTRYMDRMVAV